MTRMILQLFIHLFTLCSLIQPYQVYGHQCFDSLANTTSVKSLDLTSSVTADFHSRDQLAETFESTTYWLLEWWKWGPRSRLYPVPIIPEQFNKLSWKLKRIEEVAKKYVGLPYKKLHIPSLGGLDCSNFTAWVYNYGLGLRISSNIIKQSETAGVKLQPNEVLQTGDLMYLWNSKKNRVTHVVMYLGDGLIIDSSGKNKQVKIRNLSEQELDRVVTVRRVIED